MSNIRHSHNQIILVQKDTVGTSLYALKSIHSFNMITRKIASSRAIAEISTSIHLEMAGLVPGKLKMDTML
jgi:hypothetical protein